MRLRFERPRGKLSHVEDFVSTRVYWKALNKYAQTLVRIMKYHAVRSIALFLSTA